MTNEVTPAPDSAISTAVEETHSARAFAASAASAHRLRRLRATAISGFLGKGVAAAATYTLVPMLLRAMGTELFGVWSTLYSLLTMTAFADFGIGNGMLNAIAASNARDDKEGIQQTITSGVILLTTLAALLAVVLWAFLPWVVKSVIHAGLAESIAQPATAGLAVCAAYAILSMPLSTGDRIATALQEGFVLHFVRACVLIGTVVIVYVAVQAKAGFAALCACAVLPGLLGSCLTWVLVTHDRPWLLPKMTAFRLQRSRALLKSGLAFFVIQLIAAVGFNMDTLFIANGLGPAAAADFAIASRYFSIALVAGNIVLAPLWPAYADAASRGDSSWVKRSLIISIAATTVVGGAIVCMLLLASGRLVPLWLGKGFVLDPMLMVAMAGWTVVSLVGSAIAMFWNGMHWLRLQCIMGLIYTAFSLPMKLWVSCNGTIDQFIMVNIISFLLFEVLPGLMCTFLILRHTDLKPV